MHTISIIISSGIIVVVVAIAVIITLITIISTDIIIATVAPFSAPAPQAGKREPPWFLTAYVAIHDRRGLRQEPGQN